jgi:hypothetical protein
LPSLQRVGRFLSHVDPTSHKTGQILTKPCSLVNPFFCMIKGLDKISHSKEATEIQKRAYWRIPISLVGPLTGNRKSPHRSPLKDQGIDSRDPTGFKDGKTLTA